MLFRSLTYTVRNGINKGLKRRGGLAWVPMEQPTAESEFWEALDCRNLVVYDIGAFHGLLTIYFARQAKQVIAFEPNSQNRRRLEENIGLNGFRNVVVRPYALPRKPAGDCLDPALDRLGADLAKHRVCSVEVECHGEIGRAHV